MRLTINVEKCACCDAEHRGVELYGPLIPENLRVWGNLSRDNMWFLCDVFLYAVPVATKQMR